MTNPVTVTHILAFDPIYLGECLSLLMGSYEQFLDAQVLYCTEKMIFNVAIQLQFECEDSHLVETFR